MSLINHLGLLSVSHNSMPPLLSSLASQDLQIRKKQNAGGESLKNLLNSINKSGTEIIIGKNSEKSTEKLREAKFNMKMKGEMKSESSHLVETHNKSKNNTSHTKSELCILYLVIVILLEAGNKYARSEASFNEFMKNLSIF